jgi:hypothetical protein
MWGKSPGGSGTVLRDRLDEQVDVDMLAVGDELVMHPGEKVAAYGVVYRDGCARPRRNQKPRPRWRP